jgi:small nuclear ribonucleoprotein (snRNP)-like protein
MTFFATFESVRTVALEWQLRVQGSQNGCEELSLEHSPSANKNKPFCGQHRQMDTPTSKPQASLGGAAPQVFGPLIGRKVQVWLKGDSQAHPRVKGTLQSIDDKWLSLQDKDNDKVIILRVKYITEVRQLD